jgi:hypothetical protein
MRSCREGRGNSCSKKRVESARVDRSQAGSVEVGTAVPSNERGLERDGGSELRLWSRIFQGRRSFSVGFETAGSVEEPKSFRDGFINTHHPSLSTPELSAAMLFDRTMPSAVEESSDSLAYSMRANRSQSLRGVRSLLPPSPTLNSGLIALER